MTGAFSGLSRTFGFATWSDVDDGGCFAYSLDQASCWPDFRAPNASQVVTLRFHCSFLYRPREPGHPRARMEPNAPFGPGGLPKEGCHENANQ